MAGNRNLNSAAKAKRDKFYTQYDAPVESKFFQYFALMFNALDLARLRLQRRQCVFQGAYKDFSDGVFDEATGLVKIFSRRISAL